MSEILIALSVVGGMAILYGIWSVGYNRGWSIILEGIDMPEKNMKVICLFSNGAEELVVLDADSGATAGRPIQTIQIPKDHGNIIDESKAVVTETIDGYYEITAPTILESEEDK